MAQVFQPGEKVMLFYGFADRGESGVYEVVRVLPSSAEDERQYQVRGPQGYRVIGEGHIRIRLNEAEALAADEGRSRKRREPIADQWPAKRPTTITLAGRQRLETRVSG